MTETALAPPRRVSSPIRKVAILFAGGPAPAANAVISAAAVSFLNNGIEVLGIMYGYSGLIEYREDRPMELNKDYIVLDAGQLKRTRNTQGILIGTAGANAANGISEPAHLADPERNAPLQAVHAALTSLGVDALVSIG